MLVCCSCDSEKIKPLISWLVLGTLSFVRGRPCKAYAFVQHCLALC